MTCSEFGRKPQENALGGTDHGTASAHFVLGGRVRGGLYGVAPDLDALDASGDLPRGVDFRRLYATLLERWWRVGAAAALRAPFAPLDLLPL